MTAINDFMSAHHKHCDDLFVLAESAVEKGDWDQAKSHWQDFASELENHFQREEAVLFPAFESATGMTAGPTQMMRMEHQQMRAIVNEMNKSCDSQDKTAYLGLSETLMVTMQQHNMKEEQILYPMTDNSLTDKDGVIDQMKQQDS